MYLAPEDIDRDALRILNEAGFVWDSRLSGFRKSQSKTAEAAICDGAVIEYEFLRDQKLVVNSPLDHDGRRGQLQRLRILVQSIG